MNAGFWFMGGYARFVWPCYALTVVVLVWNVWSARRRHHAARVKARRAIAMMSDSP